MKVGGSINNPAKASTPVPFQTAYRTGDVVVVQALKSVDLSDGQSEVYLKFPNGEIHATVFKNSFKGKEGDFLSIRVESKTDKQMFAEVIRYRNEPKASYVGIVELLSKLKTKETKKNKKIARIMLKHGLKPSRDVFDKLLESIDNNDDLTEDEVAFFIKNNIDISDENKRTYYSFFGNDNEIVDKLLLLLKDENTDEDLKFAIEKFFRKASEIEKDFNIISFDNITKDLFNIAFLDKEIALDKDKGILESVVRFVKFINALSQDTLYTQIPILIGNEKKSVKLYFLRKSQYKKSFIYLNIPTINLGEIEAIVSICDKNNVNIQFSTEDEKISKLLKDDILKLYEDLKESDFRLLKVTYNEMLKGITVENFKMYVDLIEEKKGFDKRV